MCCIIELCIFLRSLAPFGWNLSLSFNCKYHHRSARRRRKCSRANGVLNLQRILPSEQKRKIKVHIRQQVLRTTGSSLMQQLCTVCLCASKYREDTNIHVATECLIFILYVGSLNQSSEVFWQFHILLFRLWASVHIGYCVELALICAGLHQC